MNLFSHELYVQPKPDNMFHVSEVARELTFYIDKQKLNKDKQNKRSSTFTGLLPLVLLNIKFKESTLRTGRTELNIQNTKYDISSAVKRETGSKYPSIPTCQCL